MSPHDAFLRAYAFKSMTDDYPELVRKDLKARTSLIEEFGLMKPGFRINGLDIPVLGNLLLERVRQALDCGDVAPTFTDDEGSTWTVRVTDRARAEVDIRSASRFLAVSAFWLMSPDRNVRLSRLADVHREVCLSQSVLLKWQGILAERPATDDEFFAFFADMKQLTETVRSRIAGDSDARTISPVTCIPDERGYYDQLIGQWKSGDTLATFVPGTLGPVLRHLVSWDFKRGLLQALSLCAHASITDQIDLSDYSTGQIVDLLGAVSGANSPVSKVAAIELGLKYLSQHPELSNTIETLVHQIIDLDLSPGGDLAGFRALFIMIDGDFAATGLFSDTAPFYRRLAALSQAEVAVSTIDWMHLSAEAFSQYVVEGSAHRFYVRTFCDLRQEPRWLPDFVQLDQLKNELLGRLWLAASACKASINCDSLNQLLFGDEAFSLKPKLKGFQPFWPGPLEGGIEVKRECPDDIQEIVDAALVREDVDIRSFIPIINAAPLFTLDEKLTNLIAQSLKRARYFVKSDDEVEAGNLLLQGLAQVAASQRLPSIAEELFVLIRYMSSRKEAVQLGRLVMVGLVAAAGYSDEKGWADYVGRWHTELAFSDLSIEDARQLWLQINGLIQVEPRLCLHLGRAKAGVLARIQVLEQEIAEARLDS